MMAGSSQGAENKTMTIVSVRESFRTFVSRDRITRRALGNGRADVPVALSAFHSRRAFQIESGKTRDGHHFAVHELHALGHVHVSGFHFAVETV